MKPKLYTKSQVHETTVSGLPLSTKDGRDEMKRRLIKNNQFLKCPKCDGQGYHPNPKCLDEEIQCNKCEGEGRVFGYPEEILLLKTEIEQLKAKLKEQEETKNEVIDYWKNRYYKLEKRVSKK